VSETDSFIDEVTEEVRRDRLFGLMRRYGWIAVLAVLLIVGGAAYREYSRASEQSAARALGDALLAALDNEDTDARSSALSQIQTQSSEAAAIVAILQAGVLADQDRGAEIVTLLQPIVDDQDLSQDYRDLANFKQLLHAEDSLDAEQRRAGFQALAEPGKPMRVLAEEQLAILDLQAGDQDAAINRLTALLDDADLTQNLQQRTRQLLIALGQDLTNSN